MRAGSVSRTRSAWAEVRNLGISTAMAMSSRVAGWHSAGCPRRRTRPSAEPSRPAGRCQHVVRSRRPRPSAARGERLHRRDRVGLVGAPCRRGSAAPARTAARPRRGSACERCSPSKAISTTCSGRTVDHPALGAVDRQLGEPLGLPAQHLVGHALERLADHHEAPGRRGRARRGGCSRAAPAAARTPLDGEHDEVEGVRRLDLDPAAAAATRGIRASAALTTTPSWPAATSRAKNSSAAAGSLVSSRGTTRCGASVDQRVMAHAGAARR